MRSKLSSLLLTSSVLVFCASGAALASASSSSGPACPNEIELLAGKGYLGAQEESLIQEGQGLRRSQLGELFSENAGMPFVEYYMLGDGNCGLYSFGFSSHQEARDLLLQNAGRPEVRELAHHEILLSFQEGLLPQSMLTTPELVGWEDVRRDLRRLQDQAGDLDPPTRADLADNVAHFYAQIAEWARTEDAFTNYVTHVLVNGHYMDYNTDMLGLETPPRFLNVLAYILNQNLEIYAQCDVNGEIIPDHTLDHPLRCLHSWETPGATGTRYLIDRGLHFNRVVPSMNMAAREVAEADERRHMGAYPHFTSQLLQSQCRYSVQLAQKEIIDSLLESGYSDADTLEYAFFAYAHLSASDELDEIIKGNVVAPIHRDVMTTILARAYALSAENLIDSHIGIQMNDFNRRRLARYQKWCALLSARLPKVPVDELLISRDLFALSQGLRDEVARMQKLSPATDNERGYFDLVEEWAIVMRDLTARTSTVFADGQGDFLRGYVAARDKRVAKGKTSRKIINSELADRYNMTSAQAFSEVSSLIRGRTSQSAFVNPELVMFDPYLASYNFDIADDPRYQQVMTLPEILAFEAELLRLLGEVPGFDRGNFQGQISKLYTDHYDRHTRVYTAKFSAEETSWRRLKRLFDHYRAQDLSSRPDHGAAQQVAVIIGASGDRCVDGVRNAISYGEQIAFGGGTPETAPQRISQIITNDRLGFVRQHRALFPVPAGAADGSAAAEAALYVPRVIEQRLIGAFAMPGGEVAISYGCGAAVAAKPQYAPATIVSRYLSGGMVFEGGLSVRQTARTPAYLVNMLQGMYLLSQIISIDLTQNTRAALSSNPASADTLTEAMRLYPALADASPEEFAQYTNMAKDFGDLISEFVLKDEFLNAKRDEFINEGEENAFFMFGRYTNRPELFNYLLQKIGYVIDPNAPAAYTKQFWWKPGLVALDVSSLGKSVQEKCDKHAAYFANLLRKHSGATGGASSSSQVVLDSTTTSSGQRASSSFAQEADFVVPERDCLEAAVKFMFGAYQRHANYDVKVAFNSEIVRAQGRLNSLMLSGAPTFSPTGQPREAIRMMEIGRMRSIVALLFDAYERNDKYGVRVALNDEIVSLQRDLGRIMSSS